MAIRKIAQIGHPVLRQIARDVSREELATAGMQATLAGRERRVTSGVGGCQDVDSSLKRIFVYCRVIH